MELSDFVIGETFWTHHGAFRCTDIGTRVVVAVKLRPPEIARAERVDGELRISKRIDDDPSWLNGPPYAVEEAVFDENELVGCFRSEAELPVTASRIERVVRTISVGQSDAGCVFARPELECVGGPQATPAIGARWL
jgi:hypothetical protein